MIRYRLEFADVQGFLINCTVSFMPSEKQEVLWSAVGGARASDAPSLCIADFVCARALHPAFQQHSRITGWNAQSQPHEKWDNKDLAKVGAHAFVLTFRKSCCVYFLKIHEDNCAVFMPREVYVWLDILCKTWLVVGKIRNFSRKWLPILKVVCNANHLLSKPFGCTE